MQYIRPYVLTLTVISHRFSYFTLSTRTQSLKHAFVPSSFTYFLRENVFCQPRASPLSAKERLERRRTLQRQRTRDRRATETEAQREGRLATQRQRNRVQRASESAEQRLARRRVTDSARERQRTRNRRATETEAQGEGRLAMQRQRAREQRAFSTSCTDANWREQCYAFTATLNITCV